MGLNDRTLSTYTKWVNAVTGWDMDIREFLETGKRIINLKRMYNARCGITRKDDVLPHRMWTQRRGSGGAADNLPNLGVMLSDYYEFMGWDEYGIPKVGILEELGL
jgi:aldehyde:ferredoxin oxidoreductase